MSDLRKSIEDYGMSKSSDYLGHYMNGFSDALELLWPAVQAHIDNLVEASCGYREANSLETLKDLKQKVGADD